VPVLSHSTKKPGCGPEIMEYFLSRPETGVTHPSQVAVVGDRLSTDVMMANSMGAYSVWVRDGVVSPREKSVVSHEALLMTSAVDVGEIGWSLGKEQELISL
jgi:phosphatidylglycerophosphatase GEP4